MGKFEDDLKKVRLEEKASGFNWFDFLSADERKAERAFYMANKKIYCWKWNIRNYIDFKMLLDCVLFSVFVPNPQRLFYSVSDKVYDVCFRVEKKKAGFGHCIFFVKFNWPFVVYYKRLADEIVNKMTKSSLQAEMEADFETRIVCKEYKFEKEYSFEFAQCGKSAKWILNQLITKFLKERFAAISEKMLNPPKIAEI